MAWYDTTITNIKNSIEAVYLKKSSKINSWSGTVSNDNIPSAKLVKDSFDSHNQTSSTITDMGIVEVVVTYTDNSTENLILFKKTS